MRQTETGTATEQLALDLHAAAIHLLRRVRRTDATLGITPARLSALSVLVFGGPRTLGQLADAEMVAGPTMTRIVAALEQDGLVRRETDPDDRRAVRLSATTEGKRLMLRGRRRRVEELLSQLHQLSAADRKTLREAADILALLAVSPSAPHPEGRSGDGGEVDHDVDHARP